MRVPVLSNAIAVIRPASSSAAPPFTNTALQPINLTDPRAMPLEAFIAETVAALEAGEPEAYVTSARQRRDAQRTGDIAATQRLNDLMA